MTVNDIFKMAIALVDLIADDGTVDTAKTADYKARTPHLVNLFQMELIKTGDLYTRYPIAHKALKNMLGADYFDIYEYDASADVSYTTDDGDVAKVYYFESDGASGTVYIEDTTDGTTWTTKATVALANTGYGFVAYTALVTPTSGAVKSRIRFSGSHYYRYRNFALHAEGFSNISRVPSYGQTVKYSLPSTCHAVKDVIFKAYDGIYENTPNYAVEHNGTTWDILFDRESVGEWIITYIPNPTAVTATDLSDTLTIDDYSANIMAYMLAEAFMNVEMNDYLANEFKQKYLMLKQESQYRKPNPAVKIVNFYGSV